MTDVKYSLPNIRLNDNTVVYIVAVRACADPEAAVRAQLTAFTDYEFLSPLQHVEAYAMAYREMGKFLADNGLFAVIYSSSTGVLRVYKGDEHQDRVVRLIRMNADVVKGKANDATRKRAQGTEAEGKEKD